MRRYKIDFALIVITGNLARYKTIRRIVEQDESVASRWYPIRTWVLNDPLRILPGSLRIRGRHLVDSFKLFVSPQADAIVIHAFETYPLFCVLRWLFRWKTIVVQNPDGGLPKGRPGVLGWPHRLAIRSTAQFVPWSNWAADSIRQEHPSIDETRIQVLHPGIDLEQWTMRLNSRSVGGSQGRFQILFVGGDLARKGANTLLDAYESSLSETCELHIATQTAQVSMNIEHFLSGASGKCRV